MTDEEKTEQAQLQAKCLKLDGEPRKNAETYDLERLKELTEKQIVEAPLSQDEEVEMAKLEAMANSGRSVMPCFMNRLSKLRKRVEANKKK